MLSTGTHGLLLALVFLAASSRNAATQDVRMVDAGGHRLQMEFKGHGPGTVVFESGAEGGVDQWRQLRDVVAPFARTVIYERAGFGASEAGPLPLTAERVAVDLHTALTNAGIQMPFVLVGHSLGGLFSLVYASRYPRDIAALVLVDAATAAVYEHMRDSLPEMWAARSDATPWTSRGLPAPRAVLQQLAAIPETVDQAKAAGPLPPVPVLVFSAAVILPESPPGVPGSSRWLQFQQALVASIRGARQTSLPSANHMSILTEPDLAHAIVQLVERKAPE